MTMHIAHVTATFPPSPGDAGIVCYHQARELARRGHAIHVFTARDCAAAQGEAAGAARETIRTDGFTLHRLRPLAWLDDAPLLPLLARLRDFDIVHLHCPFALCAELTTLAAALGRARLIVTYHHDTVGSGLWRELAGRLASWSSRHTALAHADRILFVSQGHAETGEQRSVYFRRRERCRVLPNGVDTWHFRPCHDRAETRQRLGLPLDAPVVGFVGALDAAHQHKGLAVLLGALARPELGEVRLLVVGDGEQASYYRRLAAQGGMADRVCFAGGAGHAALPQLYRACDAVAMPSLLPEPFGIVAAEALACGVPVVASDGPGVRTLLCHGSTALLTPPGQPAALAHALRQLLDDPALRRLIGQCGRMTVEARCSWSHIGAQLEAIYQQAVWGSPTLSQSEVWGRR